MFYEHVEYSEIIRNQHIFTIKHKILLRKICSHTLSCIHGTPINVWNSTNRLTCYMIHSPTPKSQICNLDLVASSTRANSHANHKNHKASNNRYHHDLAIQSITGINRKNNSILDRPITRRNSRNHWLLLLVLHNTLCT